MIIGLKQVFRYCAFTLCRLYLKTQEYKLDRPLLIPFLQLGYPVVQINTVKVLLLYFLEAISHSYAIITLILLFCITNITLSCFVSSIAFFDNLHTWVPCGKSSNIFNSKFQDVRLKDILGTFGILVRSLPSFK